MFVCDECLEKNYTNSPSFFRSFGNCEDCGHARDCNDIRCGNLVAKSGAKKKRAKA